MPLSDPDRMRVCSSDSKTQADQLVDLLQHLCQHDLNSMANVWLLAMLLLQEFQDFLAELKLNLASSRCP